MLRKFLGILFISACSLAGADALACSLIATEEVKIKEKLASGIADELGWEVSSINLDDITFPVLHTPLGLGADCSGLDAFHHSAGFRITDEECTYEGVAVLMGYWYTNPVAVHHKKRCR
jgi:hypothetical protein